MRLSRLCVRMSVLCESEWCETFDENVNSLLFFLIRVVLNNPPESKIFNSKNNLPSKTKKKYVMKTSIC